MAMTCSGKYVAYPVVQLSDRTWPDNPINRAPVWCSIDLRDGNQALPVPMSVDEKLEMFRLLVDIGFREIEVGFPSASAIEYEFVRKLVEGDLIPDHVTIQVLTQAREHLIRRTFDALDGVKSGIVHLYNSTSTVQRDVVFRKNRDEITNIAVEGTKLVRKLKQESGNPGIRLQYSPESFTGTELDYALDVCHAVMDAWGADEDEKVIINLPSTVEMSTPNVFADRIEWFCRNLSDRDAAVVSVHTHNDRGTAVASAELAVMAGADRVEGALFGNGERCGNLDIVTMALNLYTQGIDPQLDFSSLSHVIDVYRDCTRMPVHPRHPYAGELVYTAFSGSHQDAINKGMKAHAESCSGAWNVPYLPIDPKDVGFSYKAIVRINSQSGKGGVAYVMESEFGYHIPRWLQPDFGAVVQAVVDKEGRELSAAEIRELFNREYIRLNDPYVLKKCHISWEDEDPERNDEEATTITSAIASGTREFGFTARGNGPVDAFVRGFSRESGMVFTVSEYAEHAIGHSADTLAIAYVKISDDNGSSSFGAGIDSNISLASIKAVLSAVNRTAVRES
ncbi:2-isopropylmalate synthase [Prosthecochloris sp. HL-130-GSB]|jgi:2-isopropylmalate synthase|uniref:2-isopropylmalate synthase n=1 Tax=Prosthecochloris sp. HL-130-GSB TaxID=1974213 RepID=UPI000A1BFFBA|nr:2-isopropylmalate synthase [Prosthecochloris sp. HL-130-GSB]ARM30139.1 2-isopropylmalate synthase [Prosthecochloris sp. HL-130-GSB]MBO8091720.1 2-isopropylmalate synthase [Prosthecochloris sp.]